MSDALGFMEQGYRAYGVQAALSIATFGYAGSQSGTVIANDSVSTSRWDSLDRVYLHQDGCRVAGESTRNCTAMCLERPELIWVGRLAMPNLINCLLYPSVAELMRQGNFSQEDAAALRDMGFLDSSRVNTTALKQNVLKCPISYCEQNSCKMDDSIVPYCDSNYVEQLPASSYSYSYACSNKTRPSVESTWSPTTRLIMTGNVTGSTPVDYCEAMGSGNGMSPDIGGPGVVISYMMQLVMIGVLWTALGIASGWIRNVLFWIFVLPRLLLSATSRQSRHRRLRHDCQLTASMQKRARDSQFRAGTLSALLEFQKAQCLFTIAVSAAAVYGLTQAQLPLDSSTLPALRLNVGLVNVVVLAQMSSTAAGLYVLHSNHKRSWLVTAMTLAAVAMLVAAGVINRRVSEDPISALREETQSLPECGFESPARFCDAVGRYVSDDELTDKTDGGLAGTLGIITLAASFLAVGATCAAQLPLRRLAGLAGIDKALQRLPGGGNASRPPRLLRWLWKRPAPQSTLGQVSHLLGLATAWSVLVTLVEMMLTTVLFTTLAANFVNLIDLTSFGPSTSLYVSDALAVWSFGQIVAITIWVPVWVDWVYAVFFGLGESSSHRYPDNWRVKKDDDTTDGAASTLQHDDARSDRASRRRDADAYADTDADADESAVKRMCYSAVRDDCQGTSIEQGRHPWHEQQRQRQQQRAQQQQDQQQDRQDQQNQQQQHHRQQHAESPDQAQEQEARMLINPRRAATN